MVCPVAFCLGQLINYDTAYTREKLSSISIGHLPDEILIEIFVHRRLCDAFGWNHKRQWYKLLHVCRSWRYLMLESASYLKLRLLCNDETPIAKMLIDSPPLSLIIIFPYHHLMSTHFPENMLLALEDPARVCSISIDLQSLVNSGLFLALDRAFPTLDTLSLSSQGSNSLMLPENFVAPHLHAIHLENVCISMASLLLTNATANLVSLRLERISASSYFPPERLAEHVSNIPQLENLSIGFSAIYPSPLPDLEGHPRITRVMLPSLWRLTFKGHSIYLEAMLALISTPLLQYFHVTYFPCRTLHLQNLSEFLNTIENLKFRTAVVSLSRSVTINYHQREPSPDSLSCFVFYIDGLFGANHWELASAMVQICTAAAPALPVVECLALEFEQPYVPNDFHVRSGFWYDFLRLFGALRELRVDNTLVPELCEVLNPNNWVTREELLPMLSELVVVSGVDLGSSYTPFSLLIRARRLAGHSINLRVIKQCPPSPTHTLSEYTI